MMEKLENNLKHLLLQDVEFMLDGKTIKRGKIKLFNTKQFFIRFKLEVDGDTKDWELPYPFKLDVEDTELIFNYALSAFCPPTELSFYKMKLIDKDNASKLYNSHLRVVTSLSSTT